MSDTIKMLADKFEPRTKFRHFVFSFFPFFFIRFSRLTSFRIWIETITYFLFLLFYLNGQRGKKELFSPANNDKRTQRIARETEKNGNDFFWFYFHLETSATIKANSSDSINTIRNIFCCCFDVDFFDIVIAGSLQNRKYSHSFEVKTGRQKFNLEI